MEGSILGAEGVEMEEESKVDGSTASEPGRVAEGDGAFAWAANGKGSV